MGAVKINAGEGTPTLAFGLGAIFVHPQTGDSPDEYLRMTDRRLYQDKDAPARAARGASVIVG